MVTKWFPKHEIKQMAIAFGSQETIHATAYSYLNETLGLEDFAAFMHEPTIAAKFEYLISTESDYTHEDLIKSPKARKDAARSLAIFSAFAEGVSLYSSFAVLYSFQMRNMLKGIGQQMKWSVRDESLHSKMGCQLFRHMCDEYPELKEDVRYEVEYAAKLMVDMEHKFINKMFEEGDLLNLKAEDVKNFISRRANEKLMELGYDPILEYDIESANQLEWFDHLTGGTTHTDFFAIRSTDYAKAGENENWSDDELWN
jgi:ribonucleoside-diphosphate reductase beta chain